MGAALRYFGLGLVFVFGLLAAGCGSTSRWPRFSDQPAYGLLSTVSVEPANISLSSDPDSTSGQLWQLFANRDLANKYSEVEIPYGSHAWPVFRDKLLRVATKRMMDVGSLERVLAKIEAEEAVPARLKQLLPYGAYLGHQGSKQVWIIPCVWEVGVSYDSEHRARPVRLGHIRVWAYDAETAEKVGFVTCK